MKRLIPLLLVSGLSILANAQVIGTRAALNGMLTSSTTDDFETFNIGVSSATNLDTAVLDSTTIANGQGPGLVNPGAKYTDPSGVHLQWNGDQYVGMNTKTILSNGTTGDIRVDYANFTQAMGLDAKVFAGFGYSGTMDVYNGASLVGSVNFNMVGNAAESFFLGYRNDAGISHVIVHSSNFGWSPIIDDHTYGVVPEPASMAALGVGVLALLRRRRKA